MQFSRKFSGLAVFVLALASAGKTTPLSAPGENEVATISTVSTEETAPYIVSHEEMMHWLATTDAKLTFIGKPLNPLARRGPEDTMVTYCTNRSGRLCGGTCTVVQAGAQCIDAPGTECLAATHNIAYCNDADCGGRCHELANCKLHLSHGFCYTPGTESILVSTT